VDYVETSVQPLYPFGYGLSYTRFEFSKLRIAPTTVQVGGEVTVQIDVTNTGERSGDEVVQLYTHQQVLFVTRPIKELKAFKRVPLEPRQTQTITFHISTNQLGFYDRDNHFVVEPGTVEVMVGSSSQDIHSTESFEITGDKADIGQDRVFFSRALLEATSSTLLEGG
jgi:beta-glucosidase